MTRYPHAYRFGLRIGRAARRAWSWLECGERRLEQPPVAMRDRYGRRWALWLDGRWVDPLELPGGTRDALRDKLDRFEAPPRHHGLGVVRDWPAPGSVAGSLPPPPPGDWAGR
jgi:hypothetical protein